MIDSTPRTHAPRLSLLLGALLLLLCVPAGAEAGGRVLDGRQAPNLTTSAGLNGGLERGATLSQFRGKPVFLLFWLRDCPHCAKELPRVQALYERFGPQGLQVLTVVHKFSPAQTRPRMQRDGYTFPVVSDVDGSQARLYGVGRRPALYLIGADGRVRTSNAASDRDIGRELGRYRLAQAKTIPAAFADTRDMIWQHRLGDALRKIEPVASAAGASAALGAFMTRVQAIAKGKIAGTQAYARLLQRNRRTSEATSLLGTLQKEFAGTSLALGAAAR